MGSVPYVVSGKTITFYNETGKPFAINSDHNNYEKIKAGLNTLSVVDLMNLADTRLAVKEYIKTDSTNRVEYRNGKIYYLGNELHRHDVDRMVDLAKSNFAIDNLLRYLENLLENPSYNVVNKNNLYSFLEHRQFPITVDGCILGYKGVRADFLDVHSGTIDNTPGLPPVKMPRNECNEDENECAGAGLHVGTIDYATSHAGSDGKVVLVKVNPRDVVMVPKHESKKLRCCEYLVLSVYNDNKENGRDTKPINKPIKLNLGDKIQFDYPNRYGEIKTRYTEVDEINEDDIICILLKPEGHRNETRCFKFSKMSNIKGYNYGTSTD